MTEEITHIIGGEKVLDKDLNNQQKFHKNHVTSLRAKIAKFQFEIDDLMPSLKYHETAFIEETKKEAKKLFEKKELEAIEQEAMGEK